MTTDRRSFPSRSFDRSDVALLLVRTILAVVFVYHGTWKFGAFGGPGLAGVADFFEQIGIPFAGLQAPFVALLETVGGALLLAGIGTRVSAGLLSLTMVVASVTAHGGAFAAAANGLEYPLTLAVVAAALALLGPGRLSVAAVLPVARQGRLREVVA